jgi:hypothetical protein
MAGLEKKPEQVIVGIAGVGNHPSPLARLETNVANVDTHYFYTFPSLSGRERNVDTHQIRKKQWGSTFCAKRQAYSRDFFVCAI